MRRPTRCYRSPLARPLACGAWLLVVPRVFRAPEGPAAREARRPHFVRRRASKPARALRALRRPPHQWGVVADVARCIVSKPGQVPPPPTGTAAWPCGPSGALHTSGAGSLIGASSRSPARPRRFLWASWGGSCVLSFWGALVRVVTNVVNPRDFSLKMAVFWLRLTTFVTGVLARRCESRWFDDVCNGYCPRVPQSGPVGQVCGCLKPSSPLLARAPVGLKPSSPLRVPAEPRLKPPSPLRVRNGRFGCVFRLQR